MKNPLLPKLKRLLFFLIVSCSLNVLTITLLVYWHFLERPPIPICERKPHVENEPSLAFNNSDLTIFFSTLEYEELIPYLKSKTLVENGWRIQDLALGCLVTFHELDLKRALSSSQSFDKKTYVYTDRQGKVKEVELYRGIKDPSFQEIEAFIQTEKWPYTSKGIFKRLKESVKAEKSLKYAFFITPEFMSAELLFKRTGMNIDKEEILDLLLEGSWNMIYSFSEKQRAIQDLSENARRHFLLSYIKHGSPKAASLFIKTDVKYALKILDEPSLLQVLQALKERVPEATKFALEVLVSNKSDLVCLEAAHRLYEFVGEKKPTNLDKSLAISRFSPLTVQKKIGASEPMQNFPVYPTKNTCRRAYTVLEGDSLWKISRMFKVDIEILKKHNNLSSDSLKPGTMIIIP